MLLFWGGLLCGEMGTGGGVDTLTAGGGRVVWVLSWTVWVLSWAVWVLFWVWGFGFGVWGGACVLGGLWGSGAGWCSPGPGRGHGPTY